VTPADRFLLRLVVRSGLLGEADRDKATLLAQATSAASDESDVSRWLLEEAGCEGAVLWLTSWRTTSGWPWRWILWLVVIWTRREDLSRSTSRDDFASWPLEQTNGTLSIAIDNPVDESRLADVAQATGIQVNPVISTKSAIEQALEVLYAQTPGVEAGA
jgi:hypothetical protein